MHGTIATIASTGTPPAPGSSTTSAGRLTGSPGGSGAIIIQTTFDANGAFHGSATAFWPQGSYTGPFTGQSTLHPDGTITNQINGTVTKGTGLYKGANGKLPLTGKGSISSPISTFTGTGSIKY